MECYVEFTDMVSESIDHDDPQALKDACAVYRDETMLSQAIQGGDLAVVAFALLPHIRFAEKIKEHDSISSVRSVTEALRDGQTRDEFGWNEIRGEILVYKDSRTLLQTLVEVSPTEMVEIVCMIWLYQSERVSEENTDVYNLQGEYV